MSELSTLYGSMTPEQSVCTHAEIQWCPGDGLDGLCKHCSLYVMKPNCIQKTNVWFSKVFGENADPLTTLQDLLSDD